MPLLRTDIVQGTSGRVAETNHAHTKLNSLAYDVASDFGAVGDFNATTLAGTDSTVSFQAAITAVAALPEESRPPVKVPPGIFKVSAPLTGIPRNFRLEMHPLSRVCYTGTGVMFDLGTYTTTPASLWGGSVSGFTIDGGWIDVPGTTYASEGSRVPTCIRDNGNGSVFLRNTLIAGFAYGFRGAWGSDFTVFENARFSYNDVGAYFGPGSQQASITEGIFLGNREALVLDRAQQGYVRSNFIDSSVADIVVEYNAASVRSGVVASTGLSFAAMPWNFDDCQFESNADGAGTRIPAQHIWTKGDSAGYPQYVSVRRPVLVSGGPPSSSNAFWRNGQGTRHILEGLVVYGSQIKYAVAVAATAPNFVQRNTRQADGSAGLVLWDTESALTITADDFNSRQQGPTGAVLRSWRKSTDTFDRLQVTANGELKIGDGTTAPFAIVQALSTIVLGASGAQWRFTMPAVGAAAIDVTAIASPTGSWQRWKNSAAAVASEIDVNGNYKGGVFTKAGALVDGDFAVVRDGLWGINTTASTIMVRIGGVWKSTAALT